VKVTIEELHESGNYELAETLDYRSMLGFVIRHMKPRGFVMVSFYVFLGITVFIGVLVSVFLLVKNTTGFVVTIGKGIFILVISMVPLIPIHELLHGLAFKLIGAKKLTFGANLKEMVFYVTSHGFVLNQRQFYFIALTPFAVLNILFIPFLFVNSINIQWIAAMLLAFHTSCCIGDFALMAYFARSSKHADFYTYDDVLTKTSYFFRKIR
jgi:hypothetical protein